MCDRLPSFRRYAKTGVTSGLNITYGQGMCWYLGHKDPHKDVDSVYKNNEIIGLAKSQEDQRKIISYFDIAKIPDKYKKDKSYYDESATSEMKFTLKLPETSVLRKDKKLAQVLSQTLEPTCSPLLADEQDLVGLPKAYFIILEWDFLKDEGLLYAERLKQAGVEVETAFYEKAFHGIAVMVKRPFSYKIARVMQQNLIKYLEKNL
jgi:acetyl esterase/lipase